MAALLAVGMSLALTPGAAAQSATGTAFGLGVMKIPGEPASKSGKGLRFGRSVFHVGLAIEGGWDSNVSSDDPDGNIVASGYLRFMPQFALGTFHNPLSKEATGKLFYNIDLMLDYRRYLQDIGQRNAEKDYVGVRFGADVLYDPHGVFTFAFKESFFRTTEPRLGLKASRNRDINTAGFALKYRPGGGLIQIVLRYLLTVDFFEPVPGLSDFRFANVMNHQILLKAAWRFFPKTSVWVSVDTGYHHYFTQSFNAAGVGDIEVSGNRNMVPVRIMLGLTGRILPRLTIDVGLGYAGGFYEGAGAPEHHDALAHAGLGATLSPTMKLHLGYRHDFKDSIISDFYVEDSAYLRLSMAFFQRLAINLQVAFTHAQYRGYYNDLLQDRETGRNCTQANGGCDRKDNFVAVGATVDYFFFEWLSAGVGYTLWGNVSQFDALRTDPTNSNLTGSGDPSYIKHQVLVRTTLYY